MTNCNGLRMHAADGKMRLTDVADIEQPVKTWRTASLKITNIANMQGLLSVVIGGLKSAITRSPTKII